MQENLKELWRFRELLFTLVERDLRIRYKNSYLGFFWSLLNPILMMGVMTLVFKYAFDNPMPNFSAYFLAAYLPFMFFQMALLDSAQSVVGALPIIRKVYFPREVLPLAGIASNFIHFMLALVVFFIFLIQLWLRHRDASVFSWNMLYLPILLIINICLVTGVGLIVSALNTFYEDVKYLVSFALYIGYFVCPVMYFSENIYYSNNLEKAGIRDIVYFIYHLNPLAMLCNAYRKVLLAPINVYVNGVERAPVELDWGLLAITGIVSVCILVYGYQLFNKLKWKFVERP